MIRLTNRGFGLLCVAAVLLVAAAMSGLRSLAWPGGLLLGLVAAALALAWFSARNPTLQRRVRPSGCRPVRPPG